jgi:heme/copper-type cytochrome/quinol oxidase subunit 2
MSSLCDVVRPLPLDACHRYVHNLIKYEFDWQFEIPATYPATAPEIELPELDGK